MQYLKSELKLSIKGVKIKVAQNELGLGAWTISFQSTADVQ